MKSVRHCKAVFARAAKMSHPLTLTGESAEAGFAAIASSSVGPRGRRGRARQHVGGRAGIDRALKHAVGLARRKIDESGREIALLKEQGPSPPVGTWTWSGGSPLPEHPGLYFLCLRWQGGKERIRRCHAVWVTP